MATLDFGAQVDAWVLKTKQRTEAVFRESTQRTVAKMQLPVQAGGNMPVDTGFLRASIRASLESMPRIDNADRKSSGGAFGWDDAVVTTTISNAQIGQTIYVGYTASYAPFVEYGSHGRQPRAFVGLAAQQWPVTVSQVVSELKQRSV